MPERKSGKLATAVLERNAVFRYEPPNGIAGVDWRVSMRVPELVASLQSVQLDMDLNDYVLIETAANDRLADLYRERRDMRPEESPMSILERMLYIASTLRGRPRDIDRYIDYFGDRVLQKR